MLALPISALAQTSYGELYEGERATQMRADVEYLASDALAGRGAGTEGEDLAAEYISKRFSEMGLELLSSTDDVSFGILSSQGDTLRSNNVLAVVQGYDKDLSDHYIVIGARLDNLGRQKISVEGEEGELIFPGANGNGSGLAMLLQLAQMVQTNAVLFKRSVIFAAFGASTIQNAGSWYFLNRSFAHADKIDAMVNLDMLGTGSNGFYAYTASNADMNNVIGSLASTLQPMHPEVVAKEPCQSDHRSFYAKEIPSVMFTTGMYPEYNTVRDLPSVLEYDNMERELEYIYNFTLTLANGAKPSFIPAESKKTSTDSNVVSWSDCDVKPAFLNSYNPSTFLEKWVYVYLRYPKNAVENGIQGKVLVDFIVDEKGKVRDVKILKGVDPDLDAEVIRVVEASPDWKPARVRGQKVKCEMSMYVEFRLKQKHKK